jgi:hypothetical protein
MPKRVEAYAKIVNASFVQGTVQQVVHTINRTEVSEDSFVQVERLLCVRYFPQGRSDSLVHRNHSFPLSLGNLRAHC